MLPLLQKELKLELSIKDYYILTRPYRVLIIQNITTHKPKIIDHCNSLGLLPLQENESNYSPVQSSRMHDVVTLGKILGLEVDHFLLSFDYGLIPVTTNIPRYDPAVSRQYSRYLTHRGKELHIT